MIHIKRIECPEVLDFSNPDSEGSKELQEAIKHFEKDDRNFEFKAYKKGNVKEILETMFNYKCAYCESRISPVTYGDIEHFRPKKAYHSSNDEDLKYPGYYWLAMNWENLLLACDTCNRTYKKNQFPLLDDNNRKKRHDNDIIEDPKLIDPCDEDIDPQDYMYFTKEGIVKYIGEEGSKGDISIHVYGLYNPKLTENRKELAIDIEDKKTLILGYLKRISKLTKASNAEELKEVIESDVKDLEIVYNSLNRINLPTAPYLGMVNNLTADFFTEYGPIIEKLLSRFNQLTDNN
ncbi:HNH endonuclease [Rossellomorea vietnamensis]|uniref:HNH endonuclease n=1 Tax=Rossellomorea vietnamensis TaxID=218284 RepID=UPI00077CD918|nr:HNH endonuclease [Rossellomorea vietnamensis]